MAYKRDNEGSYGSTLIVFLLGIAVGATAAILYAPSAGQDTRAQLAEKAGEIKGKAGDLKDQVVEKAGQVKEAAVAKAKGLRRSGEEAADRVNASANHMVEAGQALTGDQD